MKTTIKNIAFLLFVSLMIFAKSTSAQTVLYVQGNVSDINGTPIANHDVYFSDDTTSMNMAMAITDVNGDYTGVLTTLLSQGILFVATEDCNQNLILNTHPFSLNTQMITSNFVICTSSTTTPCTLSGAYVYSSPNGLTAMVTGGTLPYSYSWSNGLTSTWQPYYQGWCVNIVDANGCDTTICDTSTVVSTCQADFVSMNTGFNPNAVPVVIQFTDISSGNANNWTWDFGDNTTGTGQMPVHSYSVPGTYWVCLTIEEIDANGNIVCTDTYCDSVWADTTGINP
ncbi:MAG: PKD domain-containing protein, partial [Flavobacteriales bacterium]